MTLNEQKRRFALELLKTPEAPYKAAIVVFGDDTASALAASARWISDPDVLKFIDELRDEHGEINLLPDKVATAREIWSLATTAPHVEDRLKALRTYAELRGFIDKAAPTTVGINVTQNRVMIVQDHGSNDEWETKLIDQQRQLVHDAEVEVVQCPQG